MRIAAAILTIALLAPGAGDVLAQKRAASVRVDATIKEPLSQTMPVIGRFVARQTGVVSALSSGPVAKVVVAVGDTVKKGDIVAKIVTERIRWNRQLRAAALR